MARHQTLYSLLILFLILGCGLHSNKENPYLDSSNQGSNSAVELNPTSPDIVYSEGWNELIIRANSAKTTIDTYAHFKTDRNACGRDAYGAIHLDDWNNLAKGVNFSIEKGPANSWHCVPTPQEDRKYMDGTVEISAGGKKRILYQIMDGLICSSVGDPFTSNLLLSAINNIIIIADKEDCPNGWGS